MRGYKIGASMISTFVAIWLVSFSLGLSALYALYWAVRSGQFRRMNDGARSIFDDDEPEGVVSDSFPPRRAKPTAPERP